MNFNNLTCFFFSVFFRQFLEATYPTCQKERSDAFLKMTLRNEREFHLERVRDLRVNAVTVTRGIKFRLWISLSQILIFVFQRLEQTFQHYRKRFSRFFLSYGLTRASKFSCCRPSLV